MGATSPRTGSIHSTVYQGASLESEAEIRETFPIHSRDLIGPAPRCELDGMNAWMPLALPGMQLLKAGLGWRDR